MTQAQAAEQEQTQMAFKRFILRETKGFAHEPQADLFRVNLLGLMLNRYDELLGSGLGEVAAAARVRREFHDIADQMRDMGFEEVDEARAHESSRWPQLTEDEAAQYIRESDEKLHKTAIGIAMCAACVFPLMLGAGVDGMISGYASEIFTMLGLVGMFAMIAVGVYAICTAKKPRKAKQVKKGRFSLSMRVRKKLTQLREAIDEKARRRRGKGVAMLVGCVSPIFIGAALDSLFNTSMNAPFAGFGVAGMFMLIGAGVYELVMADGEKKSIARLLKEKRK